MNRIKVMSQNLLEVGHDPDTSELEVVFRHGLGWVYTYHGVPQELFLNMLASDSVGRYFGQFIRPHPELYPFTKKKEEK